MLNSNMETNQAGEDKDNTANRPVVTPPISDTVVDYVIVQIARQTREDLKKIRITKHETYDEIIRRLMNHK
jgi:hypothetical protein